MQFHAPLKPHYYKTYLPNPGFDYVIISPTASAFLSKTQLSDKKFAVGQYRQVLDKIVADLLVMYRPWQLLILPDPSMSLPVNCPIRNMLTGKGIYCPSPFYLLLGKTHPDPPHYYLTLITSLVIDMHETRGQYEMDPTQFKCHKIPSFHPLCPVFPSPVPLVPVTTHFPVCYIALYEIPMPKTVNLPGQKDSTQKGPLNRIRKMRNKPHHRYPHPLPQALYIALHKATVNDSSATDQASSSMIIS